MASKITTLNLFVEKNNQLYCFECMSQVQWRFTFSARPPGYGNPGRTRLELLLGLSLDSVFQPPGTRPDNGFASLESLYDWLSYS